MADSKYMLMRSVPALPNQNTNYKEELKRFFSKFELCPKCEGMGSNDDQVKCIPGFTNVPVEDIKQTLEELRKIIRVPITQVIRDILEYQCQQKVSCTVCHGFRFVKRGETIGKAHREDTEKFNRKGTKATR